VQSMRTLPARSPQPCTAAWVPCHGVHSTTTSAVAVADSFVSTAPSDAYFGSSGRRTPNVTWWPRLRHAGPKVLPTLPAPMIAILMASSFPVAETLPASEKDR
jgi:hypothetical protein